MKRKVVESQDDVRLVVTNLEDDVLQEESQLVESASEQDDITLSDEPSASDETSSRQGVPDDIPAAVTEDDARERERAGWRLWASEDLPQLSLREILGGDYLLGSFLRRNIWFILLLVLLAILYISNRYAAQQEIIEEENLRNELVETKNYALTQYAELTMKSRQSSIENKLKQLGDSLLKSATEPPFIIRVKEK